MRLVSLVLVLFTITFSAEAAGRKCRTEAECFKPEITWKWDDGYKLFAVCANYAHGHWKYRHCRRDAALLFKKKCTHAKKQIKVTGGATRERFRKEQKIYCQSFRP